MTNRTIVLLLKLNDVLSEARNESRFSLGNTVSILSPNDDPIASLVWDSDNLEYQIDGVSGVAANG